MNTLDDSRRGRTSLAPALRWLLGFTLASTAAALWWPHRDGSTVVVAADRDMASASEPPRSPVDGGPSHAEEQAVLPATLIPISLESASSFDPFVGAVAAPPTAPVAIVKAPSPPAPPPPTAPAMNYRCMGRVVDPGGQLQIYLAKGDATVTAAAGVALEDGYTIEAVQPDAVTLLHAATETRVRIPIPAPEFDRSQR